MRRVVVSVALLLLGLLVAAVRPARASEESQQFATYLLDVQDLSRLEHKAVDAHAQALKKVKSRKLDGAGFEKVLTQQVIPSYTRFVGQLKKVKTPNPEITHLHKIYVDGAGSLLRGYTAQRAAIKSNDAKKMQAANKLIARGNKSLDQYMKSVTGLKKKYNLL